MATHSNILAWRIPWTEEPGRLQSIGSQRVGHDLSDLAHTARIGDYRLDTPTYPQHTLPILKTFNSPNNTIWLSFTVLEVPWVTPPS